uniref:Dual oxidase maturation factor 2 n=1 Tax=Sander lucioperca TaxID=283035 RepID=A0A8C9WX60_SANLU
MTFYDDIYPFYPLQRTSFIFSGRLLTIILVFLVLAVSLLLILPGIRGKSRLFWMIRIIISLFIGVVIVGNPVVQFNETIDYNEMFNWHDTIDEEYEEALEKGLPNPILYIAEKFTLSSPCGLIFQYRYSGRYASATLWTAFCCWMLTNILFSMPVILYAGYMMMATAAFIFFSMASFSTIMNVPQCVFSIGTDSFETEYSHSFWLALATGKDKKLHIHFICLLVLTNIQYRAKAFSVGVDSYEDEDDSYEQGYLNSVFLDGVTVSPLTSKGTAVSWQHSEGNITLSFIYKQCIIHCSFMNLLENFDIDIHLLSQNTYSVL